MRARHHAKPTRADDARYASFALKPLDQLAPFTPKVAISKSGAIEIAQLASYPLLLLDKDFVFCLTFDAACRLARIEMNIKFESRTPHTLMAMEGHGVAVPPCEQRVTCCGWPASPFRASPARTDRDFLGSTTYPAALCRGVL
jgi:hypothetical protein